VNAPDRPPARLDPRELLALHRQMVRIRSFDLRVRELFLDGLVKGTAHSCVGQEAIAAGACAALAAGDFVASHHRGHGHCIAKGADMRRMMAELAGRSTGYCGGLGGSMHIADLDLDILGANGVVGAGIGIATGAGLAEQIRASGRTGIAFFGDGAANEGIFHEALNLAALWKLPVVYLIENNQYGLSTRIDEATSIARLSDRAAAYGMPGFRIDGNDVEAVIEATRAAIGRARGGDGPALIEALTWRWDDHSMRANLPGYRSREEEMRWQGRDPVDRVERALHERHGVPREEFERVRIAARAEVAEAEAYARESPEPVFADLAGAVVAPHRAPAPAPAPGERKLSFPEAIAEALAQEMERDERVFVMGEDVGRIGGIFGATRGLQERLGSARVRDTPISEQAIGLAAVGAALRGLRPVVEIQLFDFVTLMMDSIVNQAAKLRFMLGGRATLPIVFRGPQGGGVRLGAQHSQSLEAWFTHVPGLVVLAPSSPYEAKGLLAAAIRDDNPVVFLEHKLLYLGRAQPVPEAPYALPIGKAAVLREGSHITIVATLAMVERALQAARQLEQDGVSAEVIDPRTLRPLDIDTIVGSVKKTSRLLVVHEGWKHGGFGAEVSALVAEHAIDWLDAPIARVTSRDVPMPYNDKLEREAMPQVADITAAASALVRRDEPRA
jgi:2-oxoisovalerate dehydrogenase E1 component